MSISLEQKIKMLMESKQGEEQISEESIEQLDEKETITTKGGATITDDDSDDKDSDDSDESEKDDDSEDNAEGAEEDPSDEDTEYSQDPGETKKNKVAVKEGTDPFGKLTSNGGDSSGDAGKTAKLKVGLGRKEGSAGKLPAPPSTGKTDDNGDNARLKSGLGKKESGGKLTGPAAGGGENPDSARNNAGTDIQKGADKNPMGMKEHMSALFQGEELSEEFQVKAATIFEAAVESVAAERVDALAEEYAQEIVRLQEEQEQLVIEAVQQVQEELVDQVDGFLNVIVEQWVEENQVALESGMKVELVNGFIDGLKTLFAEHYVDIPEDKLDVIEEQSAEIELLADATNELSEKNGALMAELVSLKSQLVFESVADDLTDIQTEKFKELVENVEFTTVEDYAEKLETLKESYFPQGRSTGASSIETISESAPATATTPVMDQYVKAVTQNLRFR
jgi:hypothetical protein